MKQSKKLTRSQREFLQKKKIDTEGVRLVEETHEYIKYVTKNGEVKEVLK